MSITAIIITFALVDNVVLSRLLGMDPPLGAPGSLRAAIGLGASTGILVAVASVGSWAADVIVLVPLGFTFLRTPVYVFLVAGLAWALSEVSRRLAPDSAAAQLRGLPRKGGISAAAQLRGLPRKDGISAAAQLRGLPRTGGVLAAGTRVPFPEAAINGAALGAVLIIRRGSYGAAEGIVAGLAVGIGYSIVMLVLTAIRRRLEVEQVPRAMRGLPLHLVSAGLLAYAFLAFDRAFLARVLGG